MLEVDGVKLCQSLVISRYLAKLAGIAGKDEIEEAKAEVVVHTINDIVSSE